MFKTIIEISETNLSLITQAKQTELIEVFVKVSL